MTKDFRFARRHFLTGGASLAALYLSGCAAGGPGRPSTELGTPIASEYLMMYSAMPSEPYMVPPVNLRRLDPKYYRQVVDYPTTERPGTLVVDTANRFLYLVQPGGKAIRYGVGIGREGFAWSGKGYIGRKAEWPTWTPPAEMVKRDAEAAKYADGMDPGPSNPLGARALYIYNDGHDTLYRVHGNPDETSIGRAVSSGCVRMLQQDIIDLYSRVPVGSPIVVT